MDLAVDASGKAVGSLVPSSSNEGFLGSVHFLGYFCVHWNDYLNASHILGRLFFSKKYEIFHFQVAFLANTILGQLHATMCQIL